MSILYFTEKSGYLKKKIIENEIIEYFFSLCFS